MLLLLIWQWLPGNAFGSMYLSLGDAMVSPLLTTVGNPANYKVDPATGYDGVARLIVTFSSGTYGGSGVLLKGGRYLLTAAHMVNDGTGLASSFSASFFTAGGTLNVTGTQYYLPSGWNGNYMNGYDIALVRLSSPVTSIQGYDIYRDNALGSAGNLSGYGRGGTGYTGYASNSDPFGTLRSGENRYEAYWGDIGGNPYAYDFDNGTAAQNTLALFGLVSDLGLGSYEVLSAPGDSGGPTFIDGKIAGIHSFGASFGHSYGDIDDVLNGTFGEVGGDTRVSYFTDWIDATTAAAPVPLPGTVLLLAPGLAVLACFRMAAGFRNK